MKANEANGNGSASTAGEKRRRRWDQTAPADDVDPKAKKTAYDEAVTPAHRIWDATPAAGQSFDETPMASRTPGAETPHHSATPSNKRNRWDETPRTERETMNSGWAETPKTDRGGMDDADYLIGSTPSADKRRSRWDETPANATTTNSGGFTPVAK